MEDLAALHVVLVVDASRVEPEQVLDRGAVHAVVLEHLGRDHSTRADVDYEAAVPPVAVVAAHDGGGREPLAAARHLTLHGRVDQHLTGVRRDDIQVLDRAGVVVPLETLGDVALFGRETVGSDRDFDRRLVHPRGRDRLSSTVAASIRIRPDEREPREHHDQRSVVLVRCHGFPLLLVVVVHCVT